MSWLSDGHAEWHYVNGKYATCPLDCGASEVHEQEFECAICGAFGVEFSNDTPDYRECTDVAACDKAMAEFRRVLEEERAMEEAARAAEAALPDPYEGVF